jgi:hypothetical protein
MESHPQNEGKVQTRWRTLGPALPALFALLVSLFSICSATAQQMTLQEFGKELEEKYEEDLALCRLRNDRYCEADTLLDLGKHFADLAYRARLA